MHPGILADAVLVVHLLYVGFTVGGEILVLAGAALGWRWTRSLAFRVTHLAACVLVAVEALAGVLCPLTDWEHTLRTRAGQHVETDLAFVARLVRSIIFYDFPPWVFLCAYIAFGLGVLITFLLYRPLPRRRRSV